MKLTFKILPTKLNEIDFQNSIPTKLNAMDFQNSKHKN